MGEPGRSRSEAIRLLGVAPGPPTSVSSTAMLGIRSRTLGGWLLAGGVLATAVVGACADKKGAVMLAINTDMRAPKDVNAVSVTISTNGSIKHSFIGRVTPQGEVLLPATLAIVEPDDAAATIRIRVMAFQDRRPRVLRDIRTTVPTGGRTALLRIPLNFVNDGMVVGASLPPGIVPDPVPGTGGETPVTGTSGGVADGGTSGDGSQFGTTAGDYDFMSAFQPPCMPADGNIQNQTIIDGECADNYVDPATLPDFDAAQLGDSTDIGTCFDLARCFAGAVAIGDVSGEPTDAGVAAKDGSASAAPDASAGAVDAGPKPLPKDVRFSAVTLDRTTCALQLNGASPDRLNLAIVTPDTGECVRPGECYVPIDRGDDGWQEVNGSVQLPPFVCKLLNTKTLRLATSSDVCSAKESKNPICTPKIGDAIVDGSITPGKDSGASDAPVRVVTEDFATSIVVTPSSLLFAAASKVGRLDLGDPAAVPTAISGITAARQPWRFSTNGMSVGGAIGLANGSPSGFVVGVADPSSSAVTIGSPVVDVTSIRSSTGTLAWATATSDVGLFVSANQGAATAAALPVSFVSAVFGSLNTDEAIIVGDVNGGVRGCSLAQHTCSQAVTAPGGGRIDAIAVGLDPARGYVLTPTAIVRGSIFGGTVSGVGVVVQANTAGIDDATGHYARGLAVAPSCVFFTSSAGLELTHDSGFGPTASRVIVPAVTPAPMLGIALGPAPQAAGGIAIYYTVFAPRDQGGGVWRVPVPAECVGSSSADAGTTNPPDSGPPQCGPGNCPTGCCTTNNICLDYSMGQQSNTACGSMGGKCIDCTMTATPGCAPIGNVGGLCGG
jgi:hypothetical protein